MTDQNLHLSYLWFEDPWDFAKSEVSSSRGGCPFCRAKNLTAAEEGFGRLESPLALTASNAFKIADYHGLLIVKARTLKEMS